MTDVPKDPAIYHITHVDNLSAILTAGALWSDARTLSTSAAPATIGMNKIKQRRLSLPVRGHDGLCVGSCVPFYFCPRSVMLYMISRDNHPEITYRGGQRPIVHLVADFHQSVAWARASAKRWAFSLSNAGAYAVNFRTDESALGDLDWSAIAATSWSAVRERKQAEFLVEDEFDWSLVRRIGVHSTAIATQVRGILASATHQPPVAVERAWYY
ncbi:MAG: DUF4433 domain-containing protein [Sandaracinaceae bacterium]